MPVEPYPVQTLVAPPPSTTLPFNPSGAHPTRTRFADIARRVPGGFGGFFFDEEQRLVIVLVEPDLEAEAKAALAKEPDVLELQGTLLR